MIKKRKRKKKLKKKLIKIKIRLKEEYFHSQKNLEIT